MNVTKDGFKDRQLHIEDYLQMVSAEQKEYAEVSAHQRIAENNDIITDFQTDKPNPVRRVEIPKETQISGTSKISGEDEE